MRLFTKFLFCFLMIFHILPVFSQTHNHVPLSDPVYYILESVQMRGLTGFLPKAKPYSRDQILKIIDMILNNEEELLRPLSEKERAILERHKIRLNPARGGFDLLRMTISGERTTEGNAYFSYEVGFGMDLDLSGGYYPVAGGYQYSEGDLPQFKGARHANEGQLYSGLDLSPYLSFLGDLGKNNSYGFTIIGKVARIDRGILGRSYNNYYEYVDENDPENPLPHFRHITVYSEPFSYFPFTHKKTWDGFLFPASNISSSSQVAWPYGFSVGYSMIPEFSGAVLDGRIMYRIASIDREWAEGASGSSLILNRQAEPFLAAEITISPFDWFSISSLTGVLEFHNAYGIDPDNLNNAALKAASRTMQNAFSIVMLELNTKNYFSFNLGSSAVWPKRFELGYPFPFTENFLYQNNIGDFDNMALFLNLTGIYPGIGKAWVSFYLDEVNISERDLFEKDRSMFAYQAGTHVHIPQLPFFSVLLSYTKIEPYNYTHGRVDSTPWYNGIPMETNYINRGKSLGHYLPPNSDELLLRLSLVPLSQAEFSFQYQFIRHGADYGNRAVDGSSLWSELGGNRSSDDALRKYFLRDGAYQWMHIFKLRGEYSFARMKWPVKAFLEAGCVYSYFTDIDLNILPNSGSPNPYRRIDTPEYPKQFSFIGVLGISIFPKY